MCKKMTSTSSPTAAYQLPIISYYVRSQAFSALYPARVLNGHSNNLFTDLSAQMLLFRCRSSSHPHSGCDCENPQTARYIPLPAKMPISSACNSVRAPSRFHNSTKGVFFPHKLPLKTCCVNTVRH